MAMASSSARRKAETNSGTSSGTRLLARANRLPLSKSAPRAIWAFMILSVSSSRVGMNRRAMVIIIASSWAGKPIRANGDINRSSPSVRAMGEVVRVNSEVASTSIIKRTAR